jgi:hypothetical protein
MCYNDSGITQDDERRGYGGGSAPVPSLGGLRDLLAVTGGGCGPSGPTAARDDPAGLAIVLTDCLEDLEKLTGTAGEALPPTLNLLKGPSTDS